MTPRFSKYTALSKARPDLPSWLDAVISKAVAVNPAQRFGDTIEFGYELEQGVALARPAAPAKIPLYDRNPKRFWQFISFALLIAVMFLPARDFGRR